MSRVGWWTISLLSNPNLSGPKKTHHLQKQQYPAVGLKFCVVSASLPLVLPSKPLFRDPTAVVGAVPVRFVPRKGLANN